MVHRPNPACHLASAVKFSWNTTMSIPLLIIYDHFCTTETEPWQFDNTLSIYIILLGRRQQLPKHARNQQSQTAVLHLITTQLRRWRCYEPRGDGESWGGEVSGLSEARPPPTRPGPRKEVRELQAGSFSTSSSGSTAPRGGTR